MTNEDADKLIDMKLKPTTLTDEQIANMPIRTAKEMVDELNEYIEFIETPLVLTEKHKNIIKSFSNKIKIPK